MTDADGLARGMEATRCKQRRAREKECSAEKDGMRVLRHEE
jgi:hypothetical protein